MFLNELSQHQTVVANQKGTSKAQKGYLVIINNKYTWSINHQPSNSQEQCNQPSNGPILIEGLWSKNLKIIILNPKPWRFGSDDFLFNWVSRLKIDMFEPPLTIPETNSLRLKMGGWIMLVSERVKEETKVYIFRAPAKGNYCCNMGAFLMI